MICDFVIDSFAWIEYFRGSEKAKIIDEYLQYHSIATPTIVLAELSDYYERGKIRDWDRDMLFISSKTTIVDLTKDIAITAGQIKNIVREKYADKKHFGLADAIILATARKLTAKVLTGDIHFKNLKDAVLLE